MPRRACEEVVLPHLDAAFNDARWLTRDDADAQDVVQAAYVRALRLFWSLRGPQSALSCGAGSPAQGDRDRAHTTAVRTPPPRLGGGRDDGCAAWRRDGRPDGGREAFRC